MSTDELRPLAREVVDRAREARTPSDAQRDRAYQALMAGLAGSTTLGATKAAAAGAKVAGKSALLWLKWAVPLAVAAAAGVGGYVWLGSRHTAQVTPVHVAPMHVAVPPPVAAPIAAPPNSADSAETAAPASAASVALAAPPSAKPPTQAKANADDLVQELALLHQALAASRSGNAARALELAREHAERYPNSHLRTERDAIEVRSLCALGKTGEARAIARRLRARTPGSPVSAALEETCVGK